jgi:hypothetical protein
MKKQIQFALVGIAAAAALVMVGCFVMACDNSSTPESDAIKETKQINWEDNTESDLPPAPRVVTQVELVNNTGSTITVYEPVHYFYKSTEEFLFGGDDAGKLCTVGGNKTGSFVFKWYPNNSLVTSDTEDAEEKNPTAETVKKNFRPYVNSFLLPIQIDNTTYYLAGWPQSMGGVPAMENIDSAKINGNIVRYGIGYGNNTEVLLHPQYGFAYLPYIIDYEEDGRTVERNFGLADFILGKAVITINAPNTIEYKTESLEAHTWGDYNSKWGY